MHQSAVLRSLTQQTGLEVFQRPRDFTIAQSFSQLQRQSCAPVVVEKHLTKGNRSSMGLLTFEVLWQRNQPPIAARASRSRILLHDALSVREHHSLRNVTQPRSALTVVEISSGTTVDSHALFFSASTHSSLSSPSRTLNLILFVLSEAAQH